MCPLAPVINIRLSSTAMSPAYHLATVPNLLSASRLLLAGPACWLVVTGQWQFAAAVVLFAVATDLADGTIARQTGTVTAFGGLIDHFSDAVFVTSLLAGLAVQDLVPVLLPVLVVASFGQYVADSNALRGQILRTSFLGRSNGIAYFVLGGFPPMQHLVDWYPLGDSAFQVAGWVMVATTVVSMGDRLQTLIRLRRG